jgi:hypothetical protein
MARVDNQKQAFEFLVDHLDSQEPFTRDEFKSVANWTGSTFPTYWSKQFKPFMVEVDGGQLRVSEAFRPYTTWERFRQHVTQVRRVTSTDYKHFKYDNLLVYEFIMPLTNEAPLRDTLDALFFKDTILAKLKSLDIAELEAHFSRDNNEAEKEYLDRICGWISKTFVGYPVSHVGGRFRTEKLSTREEAAEIERRRRYLIDETTAVTRFIFPCDEDHQRVDWFFHSLFVKSIIQVVNGEDEIWMVESGLRNRLHIWRIVEEE